MSCLLPQFKSFTVDFKTLHHHSPTQLYTSKSREIIHFQAQCVLLTTSPTTSTATTTLLDIETLQMPSLEANSNSLPGEKKPWKFPRSTASTAVLDIEKLRLPSFDTRSNPIATNKQWTYTGAVGPPMQTNIGAMLPTETLLTSEEAVIAAAAAEAVALAKAALKGAKNAAMMVSNNKIKCDINPAEISPTIGESKVSKSNLTANHISEYPLSESDNMEPSDEELELLKAFEKSIAIRSNRQTERKAKRAKAAEKEAANVVSVKSGSTSRKKRSSPQEIDFSDPLRFLRGTTTSKLLTASEEQKLSAGIQDLLKLERLEDELAQRCGAQPTYAQWAAVAGVDQMTLRKRLSYGILCKDKMIKSNVRLVISIAKNYQGSGMNLQDLVQEGCRGLVRGAEKFDASKGFKFSTYAHWWIRQAVRKSLSDQSRMIRLPFHMVEATYRVKEARKHLFTENGRHPNDEEVAAATGLSMKRLSAVMLTPKAPRSLDQKIGINLDLKPSEVVADPEAETSEDILIKQFMRQDLEKVLDSLNPREKQVIRWRFGLEDGRMKTLQEIGELMSVSRERIRQIESCAFRKLKNKKRNKHLQQYVIA